MVAKKKTPKATKAASAPKPEKKNPKGELVNEPLEFELTQEEIAKKGELAGDQSEELNKMKAEFKAIRSEWKGKIDTIQVELNANLSCIHKGTEEREVECIKVHDKKADTVEFWYGGIMMKERPATDLDRQKAMPFLRKQRDQAVEEDPKFNGMMIDHKMAQAGDDSFEATA